MKGFLPIILVASSEASGLQKGIAQYYCDGSHDDVELNLALSEAHSLGGALVMLTAGNFYLWNTIYIGNNTVLSGCGPSTAIQFDPTVGDIKLLTNNCGYTPGSRHGTGNWNITIRDMLIDGDKDQRGAGVTNLSTTSWNTVLGLHLNNLEIVNAWTSAIFTEFCTYIWVNGNRIDNSGGDDIAINEQSYFADVFDNHLSRAGLGKNYGAVCGVEIQDGAHDVLCHDNTIDTALQVGVQVCNHAAKPGCYNITVESNTIKNSLYGIQVLGLNGLPHKFINIGNNIILYDIVASAYPFDIRWTEDMVIEGNQVRTQTTGGIFTDSNIRASIFNNQWRCLKAAANSEIGVKFSGVLTDMRFGNNFVSNFGWKGLQFADTISYVHVHDNHIIDCTYGTGRCISWEANTSLRCRLDRNYLRGKHWSYDVATASYDVLTANWTENWNDKHLV